MDNSLFIFASSVVADGGASFVDSGFVRCLAAFAVTYWLHSTLLLAAAWLLLRTLKPDSHFIRERVWKIAAMTGFVTAAAQLATGLGIPVLSTSTTSMSDLPVDDSADSGTRLRTQDSAEVSRHLATSLMMVQESLNQLGEGLPKTLAESKSRPSETMSPQKKPAGPEEPKPSQAPSVTFLPIDDPERLAFEGNGAVQSVGPPIGEAGRLASDASRPGSDSESTSNELIGKAVRWLVAVWFSSSLLWFVWQTLRFRWQMRHVRAASPSHRKLLDTICESRGVTRKVRLLRSDQFVEPVAYGLLGWTILLPSQIEKRLNRDELTALLSHELAHLTRGDIVWLLIGRVLTTCFAFQPMNFLAKRSWQEHAEFQCDDWAVDRNVDRLTLARSLTLVAEWRAGQVRCAGVVSAGGSHFHVSDRVERLVADAVPDNWCRGSRRLAIHLVAMLTAALLVTFGPQIGDAERANAESAQKSTDATDEVASVEAEVASEDDGSVASISELIREVEGLSGDVSVLLAELRTFEPLLAELEQRPHLADEVSQLRIRIGLLRKIAAARAKSEAISTNESQNSHSQRQDAGTPTGEME
ncbi:MAG: beta-lactamase regulating signal transducer with metallopeptidase domain [Porticoccaceae bacterium]|jgi:beta-lactamase regulating signal transducer with metallopeptidase domain